jgi:hypothetical protein
MKNYIIVPMLFLVAGCAIVPPLVEDRSNPINPPQPTQASIEEQFDAAMSAHVDCVMAKVDKFAVTTNEPARDVGEAAVGACESDLYKVQLAVERKLSRSIHGDRATAVANDLIKDHRDKMILSAKARAMEIRSARKPSSK